MNATPALILVLGFKLLARGGDTHLVCEGRASFDSFMAPDQLLHPAVVDLLVVSKPDWPNGVLDFMFMARGGDTHLVCEGRDSFDRFVTPDQLLHPAVVDLLISKPDWPTEVKEVLQLS